MLCCYTLILLNVLGIFAYFLVFLVTAPENKRVSTAKVTRQQEDGVFYAGRAELL
jgi:hypothetical protein